MADRIRHLQFGARYAELELIPEHTEGIVAFGQPKQVRRVKARVGSIRRGTPFLLLVQHNATNDAKATTLRKVERDG